MTANVKYGGDKPITYGAISFQVDLGNGGFVAISGNFAWDGKSASGGFNVGCGGDVVTGRWRAEPSSGGGAAQLTAIPASSTPAWTETPAFTPTFTPTPPPTPTDMPLPAQIPTVTANNQWAPLVHRFDGVEMMLVPLGCFMMGSENGKDDEKPVAKICFDKPFWIDKTDVTQAQFTQFHGLAETGSGFAGGMRPVETITWAEARDFCAHRGARLPTEAEWEYAARGPDDLVYPWANDFAADKVVYAANSGQQTADEGGRPGGASWVGALDMSGNVFNWVSSLYQPYPYKVDDGRESTDAMSGPRVIRGGSYSDTDPLLLRAASRSHRSDVLTASYDNIGFRCVRPWGE